MIDVNLRRTPRTCTMALIQRLAETIVRFRFATAQFALVLAHDRGATALHAAAQHGHTSLLHWLLDNGVRKSLHVKNAMGCTPLDVSHLFGPFPETEVVLARAVLKGRAGSSTASDENETIVTVEQPLLYPMYLIPVPMLLDL